MKAAPTAAKSRLWIWIVVALVWQAAVWTGWLILASQHRVAEVPLAGDAPLRNPRSATRN